MSFTHGRRRTYPVARGRRLTRYASALRTSPDVRGAPGGELTESDHRTGTLCLIKVNLSSRSLSTFRFAVLAASHSPPSSTGALDYAAPIPPETRELIRRMANDNPSWGEERIANELWVKLGIQVSPRTVSKYLSRRPTRRPRGDLRWTFA